jgi:Na+/H+ antiporter NhaD/arsenite permease-like protein
VKRGPALIHGPSRRARVLLAVLIAAAFVTPSIASDEGHDQGDHLGEVLPLWSVLPFVGILLSIAVFPLVKPHFWHRRYPWVSLAWALAFAVPFLASYGNAAWHEILHIYLIDYFPFIILLWGLFTVAGGIVVRGTLKGTPAVNTGFLLFGTLIASWVGTTGAAVLLIRPVLRANADRQRKVHVIVFFIFLVANIGGSLTPLGDPPLLLGYFHGVPFFWTMRLFPQMAFLAVVLLSLFYLIDRRYYRMEHGDAGEPSIRRALLKLRVDGKRNLIFLAGIVAAVLSSGMWEGGAIEVLSTRLEIENLVREGGIVLMAALSLWLTPWMWRKDNGFTWEPIKEVAFLFAGIFMTIIPALAILRAGESGHLAFLIRGVREPWQYFWVTGILSSFLDNAPTYLTFFNTQLGRFYPGLPEAAAVARLVVERPVYLQAIATGAVFMGANTYIGNAPNFMVKSIAEEAGVGMPSFFGFMFKWSIPILVPLFILQCLIFCC